MAVRFQLLERTREGSVRSVSAPGLSAWRRSRPGVRLFAYRQRVEGLARGSTYRMRVHFRWYGAGAEVIRRAVRRSRPCPRLGALS